VRMYCVDDRTYGCDKVNSSDMINFAVSCMFGSIFCLSFCAEIFERIFVWFCGIRSNFTCSYSKKVIRIITFILSSCMRTD
jgi:hypothetical protein